MIIKKPKYKVYVSSKNELDDIIEEVKQKYQKKYVNSEIEFNIDPESNTVSFDGTQKEFSYKATIEIII